MLVNTPILEAYFAKHNLSSFKFSTKVWERTMLVNTPILEAYLKWYVLASIVALFPTASLLPGYLTPFKILSFLLPSILLTTIGLCYLGFNGEMTSLRTFSDIFANFRHTDVMLRSILFFSSIITPVFFCFYPLFRRKLYRQINGMMYFFIGFICLFVFIYCLFTLFINEFIFNLFGATSIMFAVFFSIQYVSSG